MLCYNHPDRQAVALCKNCQKALCKGCATPEENGFSCSEKCHQEIIASNAMMNRAKIAYGLQQGKGPVPTTLLLLFSGGIIFLIWGMVDLSGGKSMGFFTLAIGIVFIVLGIISYVNLKNIKKYEGKDDKRLKG
jgi:hypothetical protein